MPCCSSSEAPVWPSGTLSDRIVLQAIRILALSFGSGPLIAFEPQRPPSRAVPPRAQVQVARCSVPNLVGLNVDAAKGELRRAKLSLGDVIPRPASRPTGTVIGQSTRPDTLAPCGSHVDVVSAVFEDARLGCTVPKVTGDEEGSAKKEVIDAKLAVGRIERRSDSRYPTGSVIDQDPHAGKPVRCGSSVDFLVAVHVHDDVGPPLCSVPDLVTGDESSARKVLESRKLKLGHVDTRADPRSKGTIIDQSPRRGASVPCGSLIDILVAVPPEVHVSYCTVPGLFGVDAQLAGKELGGKKLSLGKVVPRPDPRPAGTVIEQQPEAGARVPCGSRVDVIVADTPVCQPIPILIGRDVKLAMELITRAGLRVGNVGRQESDQPPGTIIDQSYQPRTIVKCDAAIDLIVAEHITRVPLLTGNDAGGARRKLADLGLRMGSTYQRESTKANGTVVDQTPAAGTVVNPDSSVDVWLAVPSPTRVPDLHGQARAAAAWGRGADAIGSGHWNCHLSVPGGRDPGGTRNCDRPDRCDAHIQCDLDLPTAAMAGPISLRASTMRSRNKVALRKPATPERCSPGV